MNRRHFIEALFFRRFFGGLCVFFLFAALDATRKRAPEPLGCVAAVGVASC